MYCFYVVVYIMYIKIIKEIISNIRRVLIKVDREKLFLFEFFM